MIEAWKNQHKRLLESACKIGLEVPAGRIAPSAALRFAETLVLLLSEDEAIARMQSDREGAEAFLKMAAFYRGLLDAGTVEPEHPMPESRTPFFEIASALIEFLEGLRRYQPTEWF